MDADAKHVVDAVFGDMLHANYTVDPKVTGTVTLRTAHPVGPEQLVSLLEDALAPIGAVVVQSASGYRIVPRDSARSSGSTGDASGPANNSSGEHGGFASELVTLKYANPVEIAKLVSDFVGKDVIAGVNPASSQLLIAGPSSERASALSVIRRFDVDTLSGAAFQLFRLQNADATELDDELRRVFRPPFDLGGRIRIVPLPRLKSILVVAQSREDINRVSPWISRLDEGGATTKRRLFSYVVQNGRARDLAASMQLVLGRSGGFQPDAVQAQAFGAIGPGASNSGLGIDGGFANSPLLAGSATGSALTSRIEPAQAIGAEPPLPGASTANSLPPVAQDLSAAGGGGPRIVPVDANNSLLIYANGDEYDFIHQALEQLDRPVLQVMIEATLAEVTLTNDLQYGVNWQVLSGNSSFTLSNTTSATPAASFPGFSYAYIGKGVQAVLNNLQSKTNVRVLSAPKLMVLNNQTATLQVGDEVPIVTQQSQSVSSAGAPIVNSVELRDTGVILKVTPRVNDSGTVVLDIAQEVSDVVPTITSGINSPTIQQRRLTSTIQTRSGQMVALGGLIRENISRTRQGIAGLSQIPVVGSLFGQHVRSNERTELIILLTPIVLRSPDEAKAKADELLQRLSTLPPLVLDNQVGHPHAPAR